MFQSLYGNTESKKDVVTGQLFYEGNLLSPSEILLLVSYVNDQCLLCPSLTGGGGGLHLHPTQLAA